MIYRLAYFFAYFAFDESTYTNKDLYHDPPVTGTTFTANKVYAQWTNEYQYEINMPESVFWFDSSEALVNDGLISGYGASFKEVSGYLPVNRKLFLNINPSTYLYYDDSGTLVGSTSYITAADTGSKFIWSAYGLYVNPDCWLHFIQRVNGEVEARISYTRGASWHDAEIPELAWDWGINYILSEKFTIRNIDSSIWIYSGFSPDTLFYSGDLGKSWENIVLPTWLKPAAYEMMAFSSKDTGLITCYNDGGLAKTTDGGKTWSVDAVGKPVKQNTRITYAKGTSDKAGFYAVYGSLGCHFSTSNGQWWTLMDSLQHDYINFYNAEAGFSFYPGPNFPYSNLRTFSNQLMTSWKPAISKKASVYPNPTNGFLYTESSESSPVIVLNMLGTEVYRSADFSQDAPLDIHSIEPGSYMLYFPASGQHIPIIKH